MLETIRVFQAMERASQAEALARQAQAEARAWQAEAERRVSEREGGGDRLSEAVECHEDVGLFCSLCERW